MELTKLGPRRLDRTETAVEDTRSSGAMRLYGLGLVAAPAAAASDVQEYPANNATKLGQAPKSKNNSIREDGVCRTIRYPCVVARCCRQVLRWAPVKRSARHLSSGLSAKSRSSSAWS